MTTNLQDEKLESVVHQDDVHQFTNDAALKGATVDDSEAVGYIDPGLQITPEEEKILKYKIYTR